MQNDSIQGYRLSPQQQRLWGLQQDTECSPYRVQVQVTIEGNLDSDTLLNRLQAVVNRHEILNTTFQHLPGMSLPVQVINEPRVPLVRTCEQETGMFQQALELPFDLQQSPPMHLFLVKSGPDRQDLIISLPALCSDRSSLNRLVYELSQAGELPEPEMQFADLAEWQHELLESDDTKAGRDYWRKSKFFEAAQPELSFEQKHQPASFQPKVSSIALSPEISAQLQKLSREYKVTEAALLQSSWQIFLWRLTRSSDLIVATAFDGRSDSDLKGVLGLLAKYLPVQLELHAGLSFHEVAGQLQEQLREADEWQEFFTFDKATGFFPFGFDYDEQQRDYVAPDIHFRIIRLYDCIEPFKLKLSCWCQEGALTAELHYDSCLFSTGDIERLAGEFETIARSLLDHPEIAISQAEILSSTERHQLLVEWNQTATTYPQQFFHQMFEAQVEAHPNATAVIYQDERLSFRELNERANQLAHYLQKQGVGPESRVGILLDRSTEMVVAILAVLKAGGAYVPLDQTYPPERLSFMQDDAELTVLLTQSYLDAARPRIAQESTSNLISQVQPENLAYVIYTSGSTGKPKGVMIPHSGLINYLSWCTKEYAVSEGQGSAVHSSIAFDLTITSLFASLAVGRSVVLIPEEQHIEALASLLSTASNFSLIKITPAHLDLLSQMVPAEKVSGKARALIIGGEELRGETLEFWRTHASATRLINEYGPTESVVGCCVYEVAEGDPASGPVPIGKPIANTELYIVDERMEPVPIGVTGELYIGGAGLARGYLQRPELTAEKFVPHPFSKQAGARLYRTGDLARYRPDGQIEFLGRRDQQVKLRGYRIELGEIETALRSQSEVQDAVVIVREKRLVGYVVKAEGAEAISMSEWRGRLSEQLPEYMIPAVIVELRELPLTANGKVDRKTLPEPDGARPELVASYEAPRNEVEAELCRIWAAVLGLERVGIHDNFFELGGDSILSIQIVARANQKGLRLMPRQVFEQRTIAALAAVVDTTAVIENQQGEVSGEQRLTPIQQWFFAQDLAEPHHFNQAVLVSVRRRLQPELLKAAVEALLRQHDALRLRFSPNGKAHYAPMSSEVPLTVHDLSGVAETRGEIERLATEAQASLDLNAGPLLRVHYYDLGEGRDGRLLIVVHHLAVDIVSWGILLEDLQRAYEQVQFPAKTTSYQQWAEVLQEYAHSDQLAAQLDYWTSAERGDIKPLPVDASGTHPGIAARAVTVRLGQEETQWLLTEVPKASRAHVHEVLLMALAASLSQWNGAERVLIDVESHGREETVGTVDLTRTVGWFTVIYPLVLEVGAGSWSEKLRRVKEQQRQVPTGGIGYGVLRYMSEAGDQLKQQPQAEVSFNYAGRGEVERTEAEGALVGPATENRGPSSSPRNNRSHMLEVNASASGGELVVHWTYSEGVHRRETIEQVAQQMLHAVQQLIEETRQATTPLFSAADFPDAELSQQELDNLMAVLD